MILPPAVDGMTLFEASTATLSQPKIIFSSTTMLVLPRAKQLITLPVALLCGYKEFTWGSFTDLVNLGGGQPLPMRNTLVPQTGHTPCVAGRLFFITMDLGFLTSLWARHFIQ